MTNKKFTIREEKKFIRSGIRFRSGIRPTMLWLVSVSGNSKWQIIAMPNTCRFRESIRYNSAFANMDCIKRMRCANNFSMRPCANRIYHNGAIANSLDWISRQEFHRVVCSHYYSSGKLIVLYRLHYFRKVKTVDPWEFTGIYSRS